MSKQKNDLKAKEADNKERKAKLEEKYGCKKQR